MRPYAGNYEYEPDPDLMLDDRHFVQLMAALRICFPKIGMSISTREPAPMRNALMHLGMTHMSAIARTEPGGYTGVGTAAAHLTVRGNRVDLPDGRKGNCKARSSLRFPTSAHRSRWSEPYGMPGWSLSGKTGMPLWMWCRRTFSRLISPE